MATNNGNNGVTAQQVAAQAAGMAATPQAYTLHYRRQHPGGGVLGRCSYGVPGVAGIVVFDMGLFANGTPPATITLNVPLAAPQARNVAGVTSAVVAGANVAQAQAAGTAIATPAQVAQVAQVAGATVVAQVAKPQAQAATPAKGHTARTA